MNLLILFISDAISNLLKTFSQFGLLAGVPRSLRAAALFAPAFVLALTLFDSASLAEPFEARVTPGESSAPALVFRLKPAFRAAAEDVRLGDICDIEAAPGYKTDIEKIKNIKLGCAPAPFVTRRIHKFEVDNILRLKLAMPAGSRYEVAGGDYCAVTAFAEGETDKKIKGELKANLESKIGALFYERYREEFRLGETDKIASTISFGLDRHAVKKIASRDEVAIDILSYKASAAVVEVKYEAEIIAKLRVKIMRKTTVAAAGENFPKNSVIDINKIKTREIEIFAEKYHELFLIEGVGGAESNAELADAAAQGLELTRSMAAGEAIKKSFLKKKLLVKAGQRVILYIEKGGAAMSFYATASKDGGAGDTIEVVNPKTRRKYLAVVTGPGEVEAVDN
mgnify:CR=1 FL=1